MEADPGRGPYMGAIRGRLIDGKVVLDTPAEWPEGTEVLVEPAEEYVGVGMREEDWPTTPEGIADLIARVDRIEPFLTPEEDAEWRKALARQKAWEVAHWEEHNEKLRKLFE
jgi:hypothetical protein